MSIRFKWHPSRSRQGKFYPPRPTPGKCLSRKRLLHEMARRWGKHKRVLLLQAQAGQGKSVFAAQFLDHLGSPFAWYRTGPEDLDTLLFLSTLLACLKEAIPLFASPLLEEILEKGAALPVEAPRLAEILMEDLARALSGDFYLVFDDLHLLEDSRPSRELIEALVATAPPFLRLFLVSREPIELRLGQASEVLAVGTSELALSKNEVAELFSRILRHPLPAERIADLHRITEGWLMGLLMVGQSLQSGEERAEQPSGINEPGQKGVFDFFQTEILDGFSLPVRRTLMKLSLLEEIPLPLASELTEVAEIGNVLEALLARNFFLHRLNETGSLYGFHHLFRDALRMQNEKELTCPERTAVLLRAGHWYRNQARPEEALHYLLAAEAYEEAQEILKTRGMTLIAFNRIITLRALLYKIPKEISQKQGWLTYFYGVCLLENDPSAAIDYFKSSHFLFIKNNDLLGELFSSAYIILFCISFDGQLRQGQSLVNRCESIFHSVGEQLDIPSKALLANIFSAAFSFFYCDFEKSREYSTLSMALSERHNLRNLKASSLVANAYTFLTQGNLNFFKGDVEKFFPLLTDQRVCSFHKLLIQASILNFLEQTGDFENYREQKTCLGSTIQQDLIGQSIFGPWLFIWSADAAIAEGSADEAWTILTEALQIPYAGKNPHLRSLFLQYISYLHGLRGNRDRAIGTAEESVRLREEAGGGEYFKTYNHLMLGGTFAHLEMLEEAEDHLNRAMELAGKGGGDFFLSGVYSHRAFLLLKKNKVKAAAQETRRALELLRKNQYVHFPGWTPVLMEDLLTFAVANGIEEIYAKHLGATRLGIAILDDGTSLPLLKIRTLGTFEMELGGRVIVRQSDLSSAQRELLALLLAAPGLQLRQEELQCLLWPETSPEKARRNLDTLLYRLRTILDPLFAPHSIRNYLALGKGVLHLANCWIDAPEFVEKAREGLAHVRRKEYWQAGKAFRSAHRLWKGIYVPGRFGAELATGVQEELEQLFLASAQAWSRILRNCGQIEESIHIVSGGLKLDRTNHSLVKDLYDLYLHSKNPVGAKKTLKEYRKALEKEEFSPEEIEEIMDSLWEGTEGKCPDCSSSKIFVRKCL